MFFVTGGAEAPSSVTRNCYEFDKKIALQNNLLSKLQVRRPIL
jgi:hypothetical protein